jgi:hypothetical protein
MTSRFEELLEAYGAIVPDCPTPLPCYTVNRSLWALYRKLEPRAVEHPIYTEEEIVRRMDLLYFSDGTCNV